MTQPRRRLVSLDTTCYYHCTTRCVRRAFLCGSDRLTGRSFEHRRQWIEDRLHELAGVFAIDLCGYGVMENHYHVVLRIDRERAHDWPPEEIVLRWSKLYSGGNALRDLLGVNISREQYEAAAATIELWRSRLYDLGWFMRCVNEHLARMANAEDHCKGRFWEGRYKSQALLDERAVLQCLAYVDLNPIRAAIAQTPEQSKHTSIKARIDGKLGALAHFSDQPSLGSEPLPINYRDYLELVDWTGRIIRADKRGAIPANTPPILERLEIDPKTWVRTTRHYGEWYCRIVGTAESLKEACRTTGQRWFRGTALDRTPVT